MHAAERHKDLIIPGYTHLQRAQPVLAAHYFLAYVEKLERDRSRVADARKRLNVLPLGAAAMAGTSLPIDRDQVAKALGFDGVAANSMDVSSDRDFALESVFTLTMIAEHLAGWAEEWVIWSTQEFSFLALPDRLCTGSSIMPQKKNPDVLELIRGRVARVVGSLTTLLVLVKGLPLSRTTATSRRTRSRSSTPSTPWKPASNWPRSWSTGRSSGPRRSPPGSTRGSSTRPP